MTGPGEVTDAFLEGQLLLSGENGSQAADIARGWADCPVNEYLVVAAVVIAVASLRQIVSIMPRLVGGFFRTKELVNIEASMNLAHKRNIAALAMLLPFCLVADYFGLFHPRFLSGLPCVFGVASVAAALLGFLFLRTIMRYMVIPANVSHETLKVAYRSAYGFFVLQSVVFMILAGIASLFQDSMLIVRRVAVYSLGLFYVVFLVRKMHILANSCNQFAAFLYLCALEIVPAAVLVATAILL